MNSSNLKEKCSGSSVFFFPLCDSNRLLKMCWKPDTKRQIIAQSCISGQILIQSGLCQRSMLWFRANFFPSHASSVGPFQSRLKHINNYWMDQHFMVLRAWTLLTCKQGHCLGTNVTMTSPCLFIALRQQSGSNVWSLPGYDNQISLTSSLNNRWTLWGRHCFKLPIDYWEDSIYWYTSECQLFTVR